MKKKVTAVLVCVVLVLCCVFAAGCSKEKKNLKIVYLGDSIAEAILGPSPISERDYYGYFSLLGKRNDFNFINRSVSGHKSDQLLEYINRKDDGATITESHIRTADIIHISILGNDLLQNGLSNIVLNAVNSNYDTYNLILAEARINIKLIVQRIRELNPNAKLFFQNVYNPIYPNSPVLSSYAYDYLEQRDFGDDDLRQLGNKLLGMLTSVLSDYLLENPGEFVIVDALSEFDRIYKENPLRGKALIYSDGVHPSNEGHAVLADLNQRVFEEEGLVVSPKKSLVKYKKLRIEQLERLFGETDLDIKDVSKKIRAAQSAEEVTKIYFENTNDFVPIY